MADARDTNKDGVVDTQEVAAAVSKTSAYDEIVHMFDGVGAPALGQWLADFIKGDPTIVDRKSELLSQLQESDPYKQRFSGLVKIRDFNKKNPTNPIAVMSEAEYLNAENTYKQLLNPVKDLYGKDINKTIGDLIGNNISPVEIQSRINAASNWALSADPNIKKALKEYYGIEENQLISYALDPEKALTQIEKAAGLATLASEAYETRLNITKQYGETILQDLVASGKARDIAEAGQVAAKELQDITTGTATGYNPAAGTLRGVTELSKIEGGTLTGQEVLGAALGTDTAAAETVRGLKSRERARFEQGQGGTNVLGTQMSGTV
jgi:hypothetical protein